jgi:hypothetical protein
MQAGVMVAQEVTHRRSEKIFGLCRQRVKELPLMMSKIGRLTCPSRGLGAANDYNCRQDSADHRRFPRAWLCAGR